MKYTIIGLLAICLLVQCRDSNNSGNVTIEEESVQAPIKETIPNNENKNEVATLTVESNSDTNMDPFDPDFITGKWMSEDQNEISFDTWFHVTDGIVSGQYCAMNADASRIDCGTQDEAETCYLRSGPLKGDKVLELEVVSCYSLKKGKATIQPYGEDQILWKLIESPGEFGIDHFAPKEAVLYKTTFDPNDE